MGDDAADQPEDAFCVIQAPTQAIGHVLRDGQMCQIYLATAIIEAAAAEIGAISRNGRISSPELAAFNVYRAAVLDASIIAESAALKHDIALSNGDSAAEI